METNQDKKQSSVRYLGLFTSLLVSFAFQPLAHAQSSADSDSSPFPNIEKRSRTYSFEIDPKARGGLGVGTLKFIEAKNFVQLEFEGTGLKRGDYEIIKTADCKTVQKKLHSPRKTPDDEIYAFSTRYGDISTEEKLSFQNLSELDLENNAIALVKVEKKRRVLIACTQ